MSPAPALPGPALPDGERPLRKDAAHNRELLLAAAAKVFADSGLGASVDEVAREAGVGMGTLYRRFPTKEHLVDALVRDVLTRFVDLAESAAQAPDGSGLELFLQQAAALQVERRGCLPRLWSSAEHDLVVQARAGIAGLLDQAKQHGRVREEITDTDLTVLMWALRGVIESTPDSAPPAWPRQLELMLAGLRPGPAPLVHGPLTRRELDQARRDQRA